MLLKQTEPAKYNQIILYEGNVVPTLQSYGLDQLSREQRLELVQQLWDSIAEDTQASHLSEEQRAELDRRLKDDDENPHDAVPWEEVRDRARLRRKS